MNREELFRNKATKIVMVILVIVFLVVIGACFYFIGSPDANSGDGAVSTSGKELSPKAAPNILLILFYSAVEVIVYATMFVSITLLALLATHLSLILRSMAAPIVWIIVLFMRRIGWFEGPRAEAGIRPPYNPLFSGLLKLSRFLFSKKTYVEVFEPIVNDLECELYEAIKEKDIRKEKWLNVIYVYGILSAMVEKSPIGDFIQYIRKIAK